ncbi:MAG: hypothetical protein AAGI68_09210 [Planctomycetota bacterium]
MSRVPLPTAALALTAALLILNACSTPPQPQTPTAYPPDFAAAFLIRHPSPTPDTPRSLRPSLTLIEPDRTLRAATGPGTHLGLYPPPSARLHPQSLAQLYQLAVAAGLLADATPTAISPETYPTLSARITAHNRVHRQTVPLSPDHPHALSLAQTLVDLRTGRSDR